VNFSSARWILQDPALLFNNLVSDQMRGQLRRDSIKLSYTHTMARCKAVAEYGKQQTATDPRRTILRLLSMLANDTCNSGGHITVAPFALTVRAEAGSLSKH